MAEQPAPKVPKAEAGNVARILVLIGAILLVVFGALGLLGGGGYRYGIEVSGGLLTLVLGIVALVLYKSMASLAVTVILIVVGVLAGGVGGILVVLGAVVALILRFVPG